MVVAYHANLSSAASPVPGGFTGVDVFFVVSGFVITSMLLSQVQGSTRMSLATFYARRARRLLPGLALMLVVVAALSVLFLGPLGSQQQAAKTGLASSVFAANAQLYRFGTGYFALGVNGNPLLHTWSLAVEEQFYLVFPAFVLVSWKFGRRIQRNAHVPPTRILFALLSLGVAASFALSYVLSTRNPRFAFYSSPTRAWEFGIGALLGLSAPALVWIPRIAAITLGFAGAGLLMLAATSITAATTFPGTAAVLPVAGAALLLIAGTATSRGVSALLGSQLAVWVGDRSYSLYLWHWPAIVFARTLWPTASWELLAVGAASMIPAWASHHFVENPIRFDPRYVGRRAAILAAVCVAVPSSASLALGFSTRVALRSDVTQSIARYVLPPHADAVRGCDSRTPLGARRDSACTWRTEHPKGDVVLVGDSNAGQFTEPASRAAERRGFNLTVATASACPFVDLVVERVGSLLADCRDFVTKSVAALVQRHPSLVIIASSSSGYINSNDFRFSDPRTGAEAVSSQSKADLWASGLGSVLRALERADIPAVVIHVIPHLPAFDPRTCPAVRLYLNPLNCGAALSRKRVGMQRHLALAAENRAIAAAPPSVGVDFVNQICRQRECAAHRAHLWLYRNGFHLSVAGSLTLTDQFANLIDNRARTSR